MPRQVPKRVGLDWFALTCGHYVTIGPSVAVPAVGDEYWCRLHEAMSTVRRKLDRAEQYITDCSDCRYTRPWGAAKLTASLAATRHAQRHPGHSVTVLDANGRVLQTSRRDDSPQDTLNF